MMMIPKLLSLVIALIGATLLFWVGLYAGFWWDNRPAGTPSIGFHVGPFPVHWTAPESLRAKLQGYITAQNLALARAKQIEANQNAVTAASGKAETQAQKIILFRTQTLLKEVPTYVTQAGDAACVVPFGFVSLLNAASIGNGVSPVAPPAGQSNDAPSGVKLDTVASSVTANYGAAHANAEQLSGLQTWLLKQGMTPAP